MGVIFACGKGARQSEDRAVFVTDGRGAVVARGASALPAALTSRS